MAKTTEYNSWHSMKQRCNNKNLKQYNDYGGRGINYDNSWAKFSNFIKDMGLKPGVTYSLARVDNNLGYSKDNCVWATKSEQSENRNKVSTGKNKYIGVYKYFNKFVTSITIDYQLIYIGSFAEEEQAAYVRDQFAMQLFGIHAKTNFEYQK